MIVKGTKQLGSFKRGINIYVPQRKSATPVPAGIPTSTNNILISPNYGGLGFSYTKSTSYLIIASIDAGFSYNNINGVIALISPNTTFTPYSGPFTVTRWELAYILDFGEGSWQYDLLAYNSSTNSNYIPQTNWVGLNGNIPPTITAA